MTMGIDIIEDFIPKGRRNRPGRANPMRYITIHNTGNAAPGADAKRHASYIKSDAAAGAPVSWHYTVDGHGAYQHLPDNEDAFHCGDGAGAGNRQSIGIEICMNQDGDLHKATDKAIWLAAYLCRKHNIPLEHIVQHHRWSGKNCPQMLRAGKPFDWDAFISKVKASLTTVSGKRPEEITVDAAIAAGIITNRAHWVGVLTGDVKPVPAYIKMMMDNAYAKIEKR